MESLKSKTDKIQQTEGSNCTHCGVECSEHSIRESGLIFCCHGCQTVYQLLQNPGKPQIPQKAKWAFLDEPALQDILVQYSDDRIIRVRFELPGVHCSSCIQILEKLPQVHDGVVSSRLLFSQRELQVTFYKELLSLRELVELLDFLSYPPKITQRQEAGIGSKSRDYSLLKKLGVAGFVFGNVMLMSFPAYLGLDNRMFEVMFGYLSIALCIPLLTYSAREYLSSASAALMNRSLNIDVSISIGIITLFIKSVYDILTMTSPGYLDSLAGFIFFLLIGKWLQQKTYDSISFERKYQDYFPLYASVRTEGATRFVPLSQVEAGDFIFIAVGELIPCDGLNVAAPAHVDYSFVTGESQLVKVESGEKLYAGGQNAGAPMEVLVTKKSDQSYLTSLWQEEVFNKEKLVDREGFIHSAAKYFTITILAIALITLVFWLGRDPSIAWAAFTSVLIIACPCVLALTTPFTLGTLRSLWAQRGVYFRNTQSLEMIHSSSDIVFDKTGTLTKPNHSEMEFTGNLDYEELAAVKSLAAQSHHPLSRAIVAYLKSYRIGPLHSSEEKSGEGMIGEIGGMKVRIGSNSFINHQNATLDQGTQIWIEINDKVRGKFVLSNPIKKGLTKLLQRLRSQYNLHLLSGDQDVQKELFTKEIGLHSKQCNFNQSPHDKLNYLKSLRERGGRTLMVGDGLNDAGALQQSDISIVVTENLNNFTPSSDVIMKEENLKDLGSLLKQSKAMRSVIYVMYGFSLLYNGIGLFFAVQGLLSPIVAAILMPISSISIVVFGSLMTFFVFKNVK